MKGMKLERMESPDVIRNFNKTPGPFIRSSKSKFNNLTPTLLPFLFHLQLTLLHPLLHITSQKYPRNTPPLAKPPSWVRSLNVTNVGYAHWVHIRYNIDTHLTHVTDNWDELSASARGKPVNGAVMYGYAGYVRDM